MFCGVITLLIFDDEISFSLYLKNIVLAFDIISQEFHSNLAVHIMGSFICENAAIFKES